MLQKLTERKNKLRLEARRARDKKRRERSTTEKYKFINRDSKIRRKPYTATQYVVKYGRERRVFDYLEAVSTEDGKHTETKVITQCLLADGFARRARS